MADHYIGRRFEDVGGEAFSDFPSIRQMSTDAEGRTRERDHLRGTLN